VACAGPAEAVQMAEDQGHAPAGVLRQIKELPRGEDLAVRLERERDANARNRLDRAAISL
jgi:hypothetical protein